VDNMTTVTKDEPLRTISQVIRHVCRTSRLRPEDQEDFAQSVHVRLLERNYDVIRRFAARSSLRTYLTVVVRRMLLDWRNANQGKWRPSAAAKNLGEPGIRLERLMYREGHSPLQAVLRMADATPQLSVPELSRLAASIPPRLKRRHVSDDCLEWTVIPWEDPVELAEQRNGERRTRALVARELRRLPIEDRRLVALRYWHGRSIPAIAERLNVPPKALYRRYDRLLRRLREQVASL